MHVLVVTGASGTGHDCRHPPWLLSSEPFAHSAIMPSSIAHSAVAVLLSPLLGTRVLSRQLVLITAAAAAIPDLDAIGRPFGRGDLALLGGHRALTHSIFFAGVAAAIITARARRINSPAPLRVACYAALVVASHGVLDALAVYGDGVAFFAPFWNQRWKFGWQPFSGLLSELLCLWLPAALVFQLWLKPRLAAADIASRAI